MAAHPGAGRRDRWATGAAAALLLLMASLQGTSAFLLQHRHQLRRLSSSRLHSTPPGAPPSSSTPAAASSDAGSPDSPPPGGRDFYSADAAMEALEEAQERYAQARARREKFLMEAQRNFQKMAEQHEAEMEALVSEEKVVADLLEARAAEVKEVKEEVSGLVQEADEIMGGPQGFLVGFDVVTALSAMVALDTFYISYLAYRGSGLLGTSLGTEIVLGAALFYKIKEREKAQAEKGKDDSSGKGGGGGKGSSSAPPLPRAPDIKLPDGSLWG